MNLLKGARLVNIHVPGGQCGQCKHDDRDRCEGGVAELRSPRGILTRRLEVFGLRAIPVSFSFLLFKISVAIDKIAVDSCLSLVGRNFFTSHISVPSPDLLRLLYPEIFMIFLFVGSSAHR